MTTKPIEFEYEFIIKKQAFLKFRNVPPFYKNISSADADIEMIMERYNLKEKLDWGTNKIKAKVTYIPNEIDQKYHAIVDKPTIEKFDDDYMVNQSKTKKLGIFTRIWRKMKNIEVNRND
jgi:hypothetical protein